MSNSEYPCTLRIDWGMNFNSCDPDDLRRADVFYFKSEYDRALFLEGVEAASGWLEYTILEDEVN